MEVAVYDTLFNVSTRIDLRPHSRAAACLLLLLLCSYFAACRTSELCFLNTLINSQKNKTNVSSLNCEEQASSSSHTCTVSGHRLYSLSSSCCCTLYGTYILFFQVRGANATGLVNCILLIQVSGHSYVPYSRTYTLGVRV